MRKYSIQLKSVAVSTIGFCAFFLAHVAISALPNDACTLPKDLQRKIAIKYPGSRVVTLADIDEDARGSFQKDHGDACPGLVKVDFYGDGRPTLALVLTINGKANAYTALVVARRLGGRWRVTELGTGGPSPYAPVVWSLPPGHYHDVDGNKIIRATRPVIVFAGYESWAIIYAWTGNGVTKVWTAD